MISVVLSFALQADAEAAFDEVRDRISTARTLRVKARFESRMTLQGKEQVTRGDYTLLLKEGNKVRYSMKSDDGRKEEIVVSDGRMMRVKTGGAWLPARAAETGLMTAYAHAFEYVGIIPAQPLQRSSLQRDLGSIFRPGDIRHERKADGETLRYDFVVAGSQDRGHVTVWYDPRTFDIRRRAGGYSIKLLGLSAAYSEIYDEFAVGVDLPDSAFALP